MLVCSDCFIRIAEIQTGCTTRAQVVQRVASFNLGCPSSLIAACQAFFELAEVDGRFHRQEIVPGPWHFNGCHKTDSALCPMIGSARSCIMNGPQSRYTGAPLPCPRDTYGFAWREHGDKGTSGCMPLCSAFVLIVQSQEPADDSLAIVAGDIVCRHPSDHVSFIL